VFSENLNSGKVIRSRNDAKKEMIKKNINLLVVRDQNYFQQRITIGGRKEQKIKEVCSTRHTS